MKPKITINLVSKDDIEALILAGASLFDYNIKKDRLFEFLEDPRHHLIIAKCKGEIVGMASGFHYVHPDKDPELFVNEVGVVEQYQGQGLGRALVKALVRHSRDIGCRAAWVITESSNVAAQKAYEAAGGKPENGKPIIYNF